MVVDLTSQRPGQLVDLMTSVSDSFGALNGREPQTLLPTDKLQTMEPIDRIFLMRQLIEEIETVLYGGDWEIGDE